jgi:hypothetical protein
VKNNYFLSVAGCAIFFGLIPASCCEKNQIRNRENWVHTSMNYGDFISKESTSNRRGEIISGDHMDQTSHYASVPSGL